MSKSYNDCLSTRIRTGVSTDKEEALADAAPDMLSACKAAFELIDTRLVDGGESKVLKQLSAAIAKAEGR